MKFGKQLELGIYPPWREYYLQYGRMKRIIKRHRFLEDKRIDDEIKAGKRPPTKVSVELSRTSATTDTTSSSPASGADETTPLNVSKKDSSKQPKSPSDKATGKVPITDETAEFFPFLVKEMDNVNKFFVGKIAELRINLEMLTNKRSNAAFGHHTSSETDISKLRDLYIDLIALKSYCDLNKTGFSKIVKKYDKAMNESTLDSWTPTINSQPFTTSNEPSVLIDAVTGLVSRDKLLAWEQYAAEQKKSNSDDLFSTLMPKQLSIAVLLLLIFLNLEFLGLPTLPDPVAGRCLALLVFVVYLWVTKAIPYYVTALLVPILIVILRVLKDPKNPNATLAPEAAADFITQNVFNHTTFLLLSGYTISSAFSRCQLELRLASILQERWGHQPKLFILAVMFVGLFLSAWISNHTAPILCTAIIMPIVKDLPTNSRFSKSLLLGLAFACNFGGMLTPISSLQNVLASSALEQAGTPISFGKWISVAFPFGLLCTCISWALIVMEIRPDDITAVPVIVYERNLNVFSKKNVTVIVLTLTTMILFATSSYTVSIFGDISIISLCFLVVMFGTGLLSEVDFNSLSWHTLCLVGGGNALGKAVASSGLLGYIAMAISKALPLQYPYASLVLVLLFTGCVATFVSHTVAAIILMPIIHQIGVALEIPVVVVVGSAWAVSAAMALPVSSFPNVNSLLIVDDFQKPYLSSNDFLWTGLPMSILSVFLISTLGFVLISFFMV